MTERNDAAVQGKANQRCSPVMRWITVNDPTTDLPEKEMHATNPRMYLAVTRTGRIGAGEPEWDDDGSLASLWMPNGTGRIWAEDILIWMPIEIPDEIMTRFDTTVTAKRATLYRVMRRLPT